MEITAKDIGRALMHLMEVDDRYLQVKREHHLESKVWGLALVRDRTDSVPIDWTVEYEVRERQGVTWAKATVLDGSPEDVEESGRYVHGEVKIRVHEEDEATDYARKVARGALGVIH